MHKMYEYICDELKALEKKVESGQTLSMSELEYLHKLTDTKKNLLKIDALEEDSEEYKRFIELTGYHEAKYSAKIVERAHSTFHKPEPLGMMPNIEKKESIDHIFGSPDAEFLFFTILVDQIVLDNSDHCPIYADIKLN